MNRMKKIVAVHHSSRGRTGSIFSNTEATRKAMSSKSANQNAMAMPETELGFSDRTWPRVDSGRQNSFAKRASAKRIGHRDRAEISNNDRHRSASRRSGHQHQAGNSQPYQCGKKSRASPARNKCASLSDDTKSHTASRISAKHRPRRRPATRMAGGNQSSSGRSVYRSWPAPATRTNQGTQNRPMTARKPVARPVESAPGAAKKMPQPSAAIPGQHTWPMTSA